MSVSHIFSSPIADGTNTQIVRPSDWNSAHNFHQTLSGNTAGNSTLSGTNLVFQGGNNLTLSGTGQTVIFSGPDVSQYLTTAAQSGHSHGNPTLALTNLSGTTASASNGFTLSLSAAAPGGGGGAAFSAGTQSVSTGTVNFANSNGITFGMSGSNQITASVETNYQAPGAYLTTAAMSNHSHGDPTLALTNLSGTTASASNGLTISLSAAAPAAGVGIAAGTRTATTAGNLLFDTGNGITFGLNAVGGSIMTASHNGLTTAMASNYGSNFMGLNSAITQNGVSMTANSSGLSLNFPAFLTTAQPPGAYLTTARASNDALGLNSALTANGVSMTANSSGLSLNFPAFLTTAAQSNHSHGNPTLALTNLTGTTASASNGLTISLSAANPGGGAAISQRWMAGMDFPPVLVNVTNLPGVSLQEMLFPFHIDGTLTASELMWQMSRSTSGSNLFSVHMGIYTFVNSTQISLLGSNSHSFSATATASVSGIRQFEISCGTNFSTLAPGDYVLGMMFSAAATASMNYSLMGNSVANPAVGVVLPGADQYSTAVSHQYIPFWGRYATNSAALRDSIGASQVIGGFTGASLPLPVWFNLGY